MHIHRELLSSHVASQDHGRLDAYSNYDLAVLTPVIFPLSFALVAVVFAFYRLASHHSSGLSSLWMKPYGYTKLVRSMGYSKSSTVIS